MGGPVSFTISVAPAAERPSFHPHSASSPTTVVLVLEILSIPLGNMHTNSVNVNTDLLLAEVASIKRDQHYHSEGITFLSKSSLQAQLCFIFVTVILYSNRNPKFGLKIC
jgi:hypothetical protein